MPYGINVHTAAELLAEKFHAGSVFRIYTMCRLSSGMAVKEISTATTGRRDEVEREGWLSLKKVG